MNSWCALIAYVAGKKSQTLFLYLRPDCWALYGITAISDSSWRRSTGDVARPRPQEGTAGSSHTRRLHGHRQEAALPLKFGVFSPRQSINDISDGWWSAGAIPPFRKKQKQHRKRNRDDEVQLERRQRPEKCPTFPPHLKLPLPSTQL